MRRFLYSKTALSTLNAILRMSTLFTRFIFIFVAAKFLSPEAIGYYGLFTAAISYTLLLAGLDFYTYTTREIVKRESSEWGSILKSQIALVCIIYITVIPLSLTLLPSAGLPSFLIYWFIPVLFLEHVNQEIYRILIVLQKQLSASILLFTRQGSWAVMIVCVMSLDDSYRNLNSVMLMWASAGIIAVGVGAYRLWLIGFSGWGARIDWSWIARGIAVSGGLLSASLAMRGIQTFDRYWLGEVAGIEIVGVYVLFFGLASALSVFLDAAVFSFRYPEMIIHANSGERNKLYKNVRLTAVHVLISSTIFSLISVAILPSLLAWIDKPTYYENAPLYTWILLGTVSYSLSLIPHYALYALRLDRHIIIPQLLALPVFAVCGHVLLGVDRIHAIPIAVFCAMTFILLWKSAAYWFWISIFEK